LLGGIIGARIWHIFTPPPSMVELGITTQYYLTHPLDAINIRNGGLGIPGAVIGGAIALYFYCRRKGLDFLTWTDIAAPALALGQAIGRWGNYFNQEVYGQPTTLPWGIKITNSTGYPPETRFHPLFLYESIYNFANVIFLLWFARRFKDRLLPGDVFLMYLITYPIGRFLLDFLRLDAALVGGININQTIMLATALCSSLIIFFRHRKKSIQAASITSVAVDEDES
jgi:phosphatidylglycerol:prolipoprotein diacylglycerol transferase